MDGLHLFEGIVSAERQRQLLDLVGQHLADGRAERESMADVDEGRS